MSYYFGGPWGDYASTATAGSAATVLRPRISVKDQNYSKGYDGTIRAFASGITSAIGGVGVVTGGEMTIVCWTLPNIMTNDTFGTILSVSYEPNVTTSTTAVYEFVELGWVRGTISLVTAWRPRMRSRRNTTTTVFGPGSIGIGTVGGLTANTWVHMVGVVNVVSATNRTIQLYVNGSTGTISASILAAELSVPAPFNRTTIGGTKVVSSSSGGAAGCENNYNGYIAECAIWNTVLTASEIKTLYNGIPANNIRPQNLTFYAPLIRDLNTVVGAYTLSPESGTTATSLPITGNTFNSPNYVFHPQTGVTETHPRRFG